MEKRKRLIARLLCAVMILTLSVSSAYIVLQAEHSCCGEMCEICESIAKTEALLHSFALFVMVLFSAFAVRSVSRAAAAWGRMRLPALDTLVRWKVRLDN